MQPTNPIAALRASLGNRRSLTPGVLEFAAPSSLAQRCDEADGMVNLDALVSRSRHGDEDAFAQIVQLHQHRVWRLCARFFREHSDVEDAAQETFLRCWTKLHTYRRRAPFEHWLTRVCLNTCYSRLRQRWGGHSVLAIDDAESIAEPAVDLSAPVDAERLLAHLSPADRFLLILLEAYGWSTAEAAQRLGWSRINVKVRAHRARRRLRALAERGSDR